MHVLTACSRPGLLPAVARSIDIASNVAWEVCWHVRLDFARTHVGGQRLKNMMLDQIEDGWVCFLDDDTLMHPELLRRAAQYQDADAVVVSQRRADGRVLRSGRENVRVGSIDIGQALIRRDTVGDHRLPEMYEGDGVFLMAVLSAPTVVFLPDVLSDHNALEQAAA